MCSNCNELAIDLLENGIGATLEYLLVGSKHDLTTKSEKKSSPKKHSKELNNQVYCGLLILSLELFYKCFLKLVTKN
jgi:hypothetical protein